MVASRPEHGATQTLAPDESNVEISTTSGPLTVLGVHVPLMAEPLTQISVNVGVGIRLPRLAVFGCRKFESTAI